MLPASTYDTARRSPMTLDNDSWSELFDSIDVGDECLRATVTLARVPLMPVRAGRPHALVREGECWTP
jgi:hypothetical protein